MKRMLMLSLLSLPALAQELKGPTDSDLMAVSFNFLDESKKIMSSVKEADCNDKYAEKKSIQKASPTTTTEEVVCLCELSSDKQSVLNSLIGDVESQEIVLNSGNDNFLHGALQLFGDAKKYDGDDRGRTFNVGTSYKLYGSDGSLSLKFDSTGFSKFNRVDGLRKDSSGRYYLNYHDVSTLDLRYDKYFDKNESGKSFAFGEFSLFHETEGASTSRSLQEWWHTYNKEKLGIKNIQYHYLDKENEDKTTLRVMGGIGKEWIANLNNWKCATRAELKAGFSGSKSSMSPEVAARLQSTLTHNSVRWIALSTWTSAATGFLGQSYEGGLTLSFPIKKRNYSVEPFIGIERHKTSIDKKYGSVSGNPYENYHVFGVTIKY